MTDIKNVNDPKHWRNVFRRRTSRISRWLHIYLSMAGFAIVFFFSITGLSLNHADKFGDSVKSAQGKGKLNSAWVKTKDSASVARLEIVEYLRSHHAITAALSDFRIEDAQCEVSFKGPGFAADVFIDRSTGEYELQQTTAGFIGLINDLHKGRDTGHVWSIVIDVSAILMCCISLTGMVLIFFLKRKRISGLIVAALGLLLAYLVYAIWIK